MATVLCSEGESRRQALWWRPRSAVQAMAPLVRAGQHLDPQRLQVPPLPCGSRVLDHSGQVQLPLQVPLRVVCPHEV